MMDFLGRLAARALGTAPLVRPVLPSLYAGGGEWEAASWPAAAEPDAASPSPSASTAALSPARPRPAREPGRAAGGDEAREMEPRARTAPRAAPPVEAHPPALLPLDGAPPPPPAPTHPAAGPLPPRARVPAPAARPGVLADEPAPPGHAPGEWTHGEPDPAPPRAVRPAWEEPAGLQSARPAAAELEARAERHSALSPAARGRTPAGELPRSAPGRAGPAPAYGEEPGPVVRVTIGRVEVRAVAAAPAPPPAPRAAPRADPRLGLEEYLRQRGGGKA